MQLLSIFVLLIVALLINVIVPFSVLHTPNNYNSRAETPQSHRNNYKYNSNNHIIRCDNNMNSKEIKGMRHLFAY